MLDDRLDQRRHGISAGTIGLYVVSRRTGCHRTDAGHHGHQQVGGRLGAKHAHEFLTDGSNVTMSMRRSSSIL